MAKRDHQYVAGHVSRNLVLAPTWQGYPDFAGEEFAIPLRAANGSVRAWTLVDREDYEWASKHRWFLHGGYARRRRAGAGPMYCHLHREVLQVGDTDARVLQVDHINRNKLDNRRANLRLITPQANMQNRDKKYGKSHFRNVSWEERTGRWVVSLRVNGERYWFGRFADEKEAGRVAAEARRKFLPYSVD